MSDFIGFAGAIILPAAIGLLALSVWGDIFYRFHHGERLVYALGLGFGILTLIMFLFSCFHLRFPPPLIIFVVLIPLVILRKMFFKAVEPEKAAPSSPGNLPERLLWLIIIFVVIFVVFRAFMIERELWDGWAVWNFKGRIYSFHQRIPLEEFPQLSKVWGNWDYPHHVPLMEAWASLCLGRWHENWMRLVFPMFWIASGAGVYFFLLRSVNRMTALMGLFCFVTLGKLQQMVIGSIAEPVVIFYYLTSLVLLVRWREDNNTNFFTLSAVMAGLACWTKNEGFAYTLFNLITIVLLLSEKDIVRGIKQVAWYSFIVIAMNAPWILVKNILGLKNIHLNEGTLSLPYLMGNLGHVPEVLSAFLQYTVWWSYFNIVWFAFALTLMVNAQCLKDRHCKIVVVSICLNLSMIIGMGILEPSAQYLQDAMGRLLVTPAVLAIIFMILAQRGRFAGTSTTAGPV